MSDSQTRVKAVVFDFGGVMTTTTMPERVKPIVDGLGLPWSAIEAGYGRYRRLMDASLISMAAMYDLIFADAAIAVDPAALAKIVEEDVASFLYHFSTSAVIPAMMTNICRSTRRSWCISARG